MVVMFIIASRLALISSQDNPFKVEVGYILSVCKSKCRK